MFVDFDNTFKDKKQSKTKLSPTLIRHISKSLPEGLKYSEIDNGVCILDYEKNQSYTISGFSICPTEEQLKIIGLPLNFENIVNYAYNSQEKIPLKLNGDKIIINGQELDINKVIWTPDKSIDFKTQNGEWFVFPPIMKEEFAINIGNKSENLNLHIHRVPCKSLHSKKFETYKNEVITLKYEVDKKLNQINLNMSINLNFAQNLQEAIKAIRIYNSFKVGQGYVEGRHLPSKINSCTDIFGEDILNLLNKLIEIEKSLGIKVKPDFRDINIETYLNVERLYQNVVKKNPIRDNSKLNYIMGEWKYEEDKEEIKSNCENPIFFKFEEMAKFNLMGLEIELPSVVCVFNARLVDIIEKGKNYNIKLADEDKYKPMYMSSLCFKTKKELDVYNVLKNLSIFKDSKTCRDYLNS